MSRARAHWSVRLATQMGWRIRAVPGLQRIGSRAVDQLRDSPVARKVVGRLFDTDLAGLGGGAVFLSTGRLVEGHGADNLPVVMFSLVDTDDADVADLLERVACEQVLTGGFRPVVVLDSDHFSLVRQYGWPTDQIISRKRWSSSDPWQEYADAQLQSMRRHYQAVALVDLNHTSHLSWVYLRSLGRHNV